MACLKPTAGTLRVVRRLRLQGPDDRLPLTWKQRLRQNAKTGALIRSSVWGKGPLLAVVHCMACGSAIGASKMHNTWKIPESLG